MGIPLYLSHGFEPVFFEDLKEHPDDYDVEDNAILKEWNDSDLLGRWDLTQKFSNLFYLNINEQNIKILFNRVNKVLNSPVKEMEV